MTTIRIPFLVRFEQALANGKKTTTCRTRRYGQVGDQFTSYSMRFELVAVEAMPLYEVRDKWWKHEGVSSPEEFQQIWEWIHPNMGFDANRKVWLHRFRRLDSAAQQWENDKASAGLEGKSTHD